MCQPPHLAATPLRALQNSTVATSYLYKRGSTTVQTALQGNPLRMAGECLCPCGCNPCPDCIASTGVDCAWLMSGRWMPRSQEERMRACSNSAEIPLRCLPH